MGMECMIVRRNHTKILDFQTLCCRVLIFYSLFWTKLIPKLIGISVTTYKMHLTPYNINDDPRKGMDFEEEQDEDDEDQDVAIWSKQRINKQKIFTPEFVQKYIDFAKKQYKPTLTDAACEEIANKYGELREEERNQTLPITARCLETIIRLSTAHAKLRLSKK